jgi:hypothetical protein
MTSRPAGILLIGNEKPWRIARQSTWQERVNQDGKGSRGIRIMPLMIVAGKRYVEG